MSIVPESIRDLHAEAVEILSGRLGSEQLEMLLVYDTEEATPALLRLLEWQLNVTWSWIANTDDERRQLLRNAISWHRYKGTKFAIVQALQAIGYSAVSITEGASANIYDGAMSYSGSALYDGGGTTNWAVFSVSATAPEGQTLDDAEYARVRKLINNMKPARTKLQALSLTESGT
ncbi:putative phage tail fiber protein [Chloroherpeton thalassium ATCC 35110]|uniref:Putative phage tail fiber protein n=1 Tax=Chloroherpeton thalassium (strain ATCC 35110 / GB-78) TaxID=517418 RepID=B3QTJ2_CHLT3|nr:phage tail protein [Chloroherpeton thalassium]ACF12738.1 putative phage tail fiber protein [Chloroherpeton thalassium ATCC 35110]